MSTAPNAEAFFDGQLDSSFSSMFAQQRQPTQSTTTPLPESEYFRELAELLQECPSLQSSDMWALRDMLKQLKESKDKKSGAAVQEGDVSSSGSAVLASHVGPMVLEALDGFFFVLNPEGMIEFVSRNVLRYLNYAQGDMQNRSIFNFVSPGDHELYSRLLPADSLGLHLMQFAAPADRKSTTFLCRFLAQQKLASPSSSDLSPVGSGPYVTLNVSAISLPYPLDPHRTEHDFFNSFNIGSERNCLVCVARRNVENSSPLGEGSISNYQCHFSLNCDPAGLITDLEIRDHSLDEPLSKGISALRNLNLHDVCHKTDRPVVSTLLEYVSDSTCVRSSRICLRLNGVHGPDVTVQAQSPRHQSTESSLCIKLECVIVRVESGNSSLVSSKVSPVNTKDDCSVSYSLDAQQPKSAAPMLMIPNRSLSQPTKSSPCFDTLSPTGSAECTSSTHGTSSCSGNNGDTLQQLCSSLFADQSDISQSATTDVLKTLLEEEEMTSQGCSVNTVTSSMPVVSSAPPPPPPGQQFYFPTNDYGQQAPNYPMPPDTNPMFYHPDSFPDGRQLFIPPSMKPPATGPTKPTKPRKPRKSSAAAGTNGTSRPGRGRRKKNATPRQPAQQPELMSPNAATLGPPRWPQPNQMGFGFDSQMLPPSATAVQMHSGKDALLKHLLRNENQECAIQQQIVQQQPHPHLLPKLLSEEEIVGLRTPPDQSIGANIQWNTPSPATPRTPTGQQSFTPGGSRIPTSSSMLVKLLEHPPHQTPTLPTSIATSPLDKLAQENKGSPNTPMLTTKLAESLLMKQKHTTRPSIATSSMLISGPTDLRQPNSYPTSNMYPPMMAYEQSAISYPPSSFQPPQQQQQQQYNNNYPPTTAIYDQQLNFGQHQPPPYSQTSPISDQSQLRRGNSIDSQAYMMDGKYSNSPISLKYPPISGPPPSAPAMYGQFYPQASSGSGVFSFEQNQQPAWTMAGKGRPQTTDLVRVPWQPMAPGLQIPQDRKLTPVSEVAPGSLRFPPPAYPGNEVISSSQSPFDQQSTATVEPTWFGDFGLGNAFDMDDESTRNLVQRLLS